MKDQKSQLKAKRHCLERNEVRIDVAVREVRLPSRATPCPCSMRKRLSGDWSRPYGREALQKTERTNHDATIVLDNDRRKAHRQGGRDQHCLTGSGRQQGCAPGLGEEPQ